MFRRLRSTSSTWSTLPLRLAWGAIFIGHGSQKVLGLFNGPGLKAFTGAAPPFHFMRPGWLWMGAAAFSELIGGALLVLGFFTRLGAFLILCVMLTAIIGVHWPVFFASSNGFEYPMALLAGALALLIAGGGHLSVDRLTGNRRSFPGRNR